MVVVCDASPLIVLAKIGRLQLLNDLYPEIRVLRCVVDEVLVDRAGVIERERLDAFLKGAEIVEFAESDFPSGVLSQSDQYSLTYCVREKVDRLIADERALRNVAGANGVEVIGVLGLFLSAVDAGLLSTKDAKADLRAAVTVGGMRIGVALYQRVLDELE